MSGEVIEQDRHETLEPTTLVLRQQASQLIDEILTENQDHPIDFLDDAELARAKKQRREGRASLACEDIYLTPEEEAFFDVLEQRRYSHDVRSWLVDRYFFKTTPKDLLPPA